MLYLFFGVRNAASRESICQGNKKDQEKSRTYNYIARNRSDVSMKTVRVTKDQMMEMRYKEGSPAMGLN